MHPFIKFNKMIKLFIECKCLVKCDPRYVNELCDHEDVIAII